MNVLVEIVLLGTIAGVVGTGIGGLFAYIFKNPSKIFLSITMGLAGGIMLSIVCFDMLPEAFSLVSFKVSILGIILGCLVINQLDNVTESVQENHRSHDTYYKTGIMLLCAIAMHNLPEGLAIGSGFGVNVHLGLSLCFIIMLHNIPEGMVIAASLSAGGMKAVKILGLAALAGAPMGLGALIGGVLGNISSLLIALCLSFAAGAMLFIIVSELIPKSNYLYSKKISGFSIILGFLFGIILSLVL